MKSHQKSVRALTSGAKQPCFTLIELLVKGSHLCCDREKAAHGQGKAHFTLLYPY